MSENATPNTNGASGEEIVDDGYDYIAAINEMKKNTVSRESYEKLVKERNDLVKTLIDGGSVPNEAPKAAVDISQLRKDLFSKEACDKGMTNLEFIEKSLMLREAVLERDGTDIFLPIAKGIVITNEDREQAALAAKIYQECVDYANGDSEAFTNELMRRTTDITIPSARGQKTYYRR